MLTDLSLYLRLLGYLRPYRRVVMLSVLALVATAALEPVLPALMQPLVDKSLIAKQSASLWQVPLFIVLAFLLKGIADYVANVSSQYLAQRVVADLRAAVFEHQLYLPLLHHQEEEGGRMLSRITYDTSMVGEAVSTAWLTVIRDSLVLVGLIGFLFYLSWQLALLVFFMAPVLAWTIQKASGRLRASNRAVQTGMGRLTGFVEEAISGLKEIKIFGAHQSRADSFGALNQSLRHEQMRVIKIQALNVPLVQVLAACSVAAVIYVASILSRDSQLTPGEFVSFITAMSMVFEPVRRLTNVNAILQRGLAAAESLFGLLDEKPEVGQVVSTANSSGSLTPSSQRLTGEIVFDRVGYHYPDRDWALRDFSLSIQPGEVVAVTGPSGVGKSTLFHLLAGFDSPQEGRLLLDGRAITDWGIDQVRANLSLVSQRVVLFDGTVRENLLMGRPLATEAELVEATQAAHAWSFIQSLPAGLDTPLGSLGDRLSGGQRQRLAIARAFLKDAPILLLDEATSALDKNSEAAVLSGLSELMAGRTVLLISHAPERLLRVDRVLQLRGGYV